jgi:hypothetical protein
MNVLSKRRAYTSLGPTHICGLRLERLIVAASFVIGDADAKTN